MFTAIGRFIGLSLWFSNTVPLNFSRHVVKFLLERYWLLCLWFKYFGFRYAINLLLKHSVGHFVVSVLFFFELCLFILCIWIISNLHFVSPKLFPKFYLCIVFFVFILWRYFIPWDSSWSSELFLTKFPHHCYQFSSLLRHLKVLSVNLVSCPLRAVNSSLISKYSLDAKHFHHTLGFCPIVRSKVNINHNLRQGPARPVTKTPSPPPVMF